MKNITYIFISLFIQAYSLYAISASLPNETSQKNMLKSHVRNLAMALTNQILIVGVYEYTYVSGRDHDWYRLKDGTSLRDQKYRLSRGQGWYIMRLIQPIKGETDNLIFFKAFPSFSKKIVFLPQPGSHWLLILKPALNGDGTLLSSASNYSATEIEKFPVLRPNTLFELYDYANGALCVKWPEDYDLPDMMQVYPEDLSADIKYLYSVVRRYGDEKRHLQEEDYLTNIAHDVIRELIKPRDDVEKEPCIGCPTRKTNP